MKNNAILGSLFLMKAFGEAANECFKEDTLYGDNRFDEQTKSDFDLLGNLSKDHVVTKIEACLTQSGTRYGDINSV